MEGRLVDTRLIEGFRWDGVKRPPGVVHRIAVLLRIGGWPLTILEAEGRMFDIPHPQCPITLDSLQGIVGLPISAGFTSEVRKRLGGVKGCTHLTHLVISMAPAALHGFWTAASRVKHPLPDSIEDFPAIRHLTDSCALWRSGGPIIREIQETIEKLKRHDSSDL